LTNYNPIEPQRPWNKKEKKVYKSDNYAFYNSYAWRKISKARGKQEKLCRYCKRDAAKKQELKFSIEELRSDNLVYDPRIQVGEVTDHIIPVNEDGAKWEKLNHQRLCHRHHNIKRNEERRGIYPKWKLNSKGNKIPKECF